MLSKKHRGLHLRNVKAAFDAGVKIACGTDWVGWPVQESVREFALLMEAGLPLFDALKCATSEAAGLLGWQDRVGSIEAGQLADIIAVPSKLDTIESLKAMEQVYFVMKDGFVVKSD